MEAATHLATASLKLRFKRIDDAMVDIDVDHRDRSIRLKAEAQP